MMKHLTCIAAALLLIAPGFAPAAAKERYRIYRAASAFGTSPVCPVGSKCQLPAPDCPFAMSYCPRYLVCLDWLSACPP